MGKEQHLDLQECAPHGPAVQEEVPEPGRSCLCWAQSPRTALSCTNSGLKRGMSPSPGAPLHAPAACEMNLRQLTPKKD